jgi:hypothetical protein
MCVNPQHEENSKIILGYAGLKDTIAILADYGIKHTGKNLMEARKPAIFNVKNRRVAFLA